MTTGQLRGPADRWPVASVPCHLGPSTGQVITGQWLLSEPVSERMRTSAWDKSHSLFKLNLGNNIPSLLKDSICWKHIKGPSTLRGEDLTRHGCQEVGIWGHHHAPFKLKLPSCDV